MSVMWTSEQVLSLSPDANSAKRGKSLATVSQWPLLGRSEQAVWGECQGSGKTPYRTQIDLSEPAFRCSCPSRKFP
ncbi:MAG: SWIM zinc finger family protein, partial [Cyanobacteria bacterium P01_D01_bin.115]